MSVPPEILQRLQQAQGAGGPPAGAAPNMPGGAPGAGPGGSPTPQPQEKKGLKTSAMVNLSIAQNMIEQALTAFQPADPEYKACLKALNVLAPLAAKNDASDLVPAQVMRMVGEMPQMGGGTDVQRMILQRMQQGQHPQGAGGAPQMPQQPPQMPQG